MTSTIFTEIIQYKIVIYTTSIRFIDVTFKYLVFNTERIKSILLVERSEIIVLD